MTFAALSRIISIFNNAQNHLRTTSDFGCNTKMVPTQIKRANKEDNVGGYKIATPIV